MTTIATDGKSMAGDGLTNLDGMITSEDCAKLRGLDDGRVVGMCGPTSEFDPFADWLEHGGELPKLSGGFSALVIDLTGCVRKYYSDGTFDTFHGHHAIGSGAQFAMVAMDLGCDPEGAVRAAIRRDTCSGGTITTLTPAEAACAAASLPRGFRLIGSAADAA